MSAELPTIVRVFPGPQPDAEGRFAAYLAARPDSTLSHDPAWARVFHAGLRQRPYYLEARRGETVVGVLPLTFVSSLLFGKFLVSSPYLNIGGPVADDAAAETALLDEACALADRLDAAHLELRNPRRLEHPKLTRERSEKVRMVRALPAVADDFWKSLKPEVRNQVRKGEKHELTAEWGGAELLTDFHAVFARNMRDLGTPVYGRELFAAMLAALGGRAELCVVRLAGQPIAGAVLLHGRDATEVPSASSLREHNKTCANMFMYWQLVQRAIARGQKEFDFGRSSEGSGTYKFKKQWGAEPRPSVWQYYCRRGDIAAARPDNPKYQRKIELWKKLPLWLANRLGPRIIRGVP